MKIIALEEHFATAEIIAAWKASTGTPDIGVKMATASDKERRLLDLTDVRIAAMEEAGVDIQVLSVTTPGVQDLEPAQAVELARAANDRIAQTVRDRPDRFQGFATLPTSNPQAAARELERAICKLGLNGAMMFGRTHDCNLDHPDFFSILEVAAQLRAPIYLHPKSPPLAVREAYYQGLGPQIEAVLATGGIGWHYEAGLQLLRLILSGVFEKLPELQIIVGHWGEVVLFYLDRIDLLSSTLRLQRPLSDYFRSNIFVTPGGIFSHRYLQWAKEVMGTDRILFATDHPFHLAERGAARTFLETAKLSPSERNKIAFENWEALCTKILR